jgi:sugar O-acyltransferase (sialic acid O-acetyltransferase NeuD family)
MSEPEALLIFPCNGNAAEALDCLGGAWRCLGFVDDAPDKQCMSVHGHRVFARGTFAERTDTKVLAVPGSPTTFRVRRQIIEGLRLGEHRYARVIHPRATVSPLASIGYNVLIMAGVVVTSNAVIGNHVCVLPNTVIHHDAAIGDYSLIGSNVTVAGSAVIGENCYIGSGTSIMNGISIANGALVGLGSNVIQNVEAEAVVAGNPARPIRTRRH